MSLDSSDYSDFFTASTDKEKQSLWDSVLNAAGEVIGNIPDQIDDKLDTKNKAKETVAQNQNITSKDPAVSAGANATGLASMMEDPTTKYLIIGGGVLIGSLLIYAIVK